MTQPLNALPVPSIQTDLPGPRGAKLIATDEQYTSPSYTRVYPLACERAEGAVMDARHLAAIAPLWLDRAVPPGARAMQWLVMLAPLGLTLASLWLIVASAALAELLPDDSAIPPWGYVVLYGVSLALYAAMIWHVWKSLRQAEIAA